ncbi:MAG TPA: cation:proton antiporter, partial [Alphaproteobacteria bacterium]|nr:cation:proton antiporter [Alphaproteobacteria bacterium]
LMFGVGLHFSFSDLIKFSKISVPGAVFQIVSVTAIGGLALKLWGFEWAEGLIYGLALSVASTIVLLRAFEERGEVDTEHGKIAVGWLIVEDILMVLALVLIPVIADLSASKEPVTAAVIGTQTLTVAVKIGIFMVLMYYLGRKLLPWLLVSIARTRSAELITLGTLAIALGFAFIAYTMFDASFALGAFLAGLVLGDSEIGNRAADKSLPMRDAFAVLFFVSVGMLFDPMTLVERPFMVAATLAIIIIVKLLVTLAVARLFKVRWVESVPIAISLTQIGEFSFILAGISVANNLMSQEIYGLILAGALLSIALNPFLFKVFDRYKERLVAAG